MKGRGDLPVALVLGAAVWPGGEPSPALRRRALTGARLWTEGRVRAVVACGGVGRHAPSEAEVIVALCRAAGVPEAALVLEDRSGTTERNILNALPLLDALEARTVVIVSDFHHLPRALLVARRAGLRARGVAVPLAGARVGAQLKAALREIPAFGWYALRGKGRR